MKNVYIGKDSIKGNGTAICFVIDSDIATGAATVYNRETNRIEVIAWNEIKALPEGVKKLADDCEAQFTAKVARAIKKAQVA